MKHVTTLIVAGLVLQLAPAGVGAESPDMKTKESYSLGYEFGERLRRQNLELDVEALVSAVRDAVEAKKPALPVGEIRKTLLQLRKKAVVLEDRRFREAALRNLREGRAFLEANKTADGIRILPGNLQYRVLQQGTGPKPKKTDYATVNVRGTLINGTEFENTYGKNKPLTVPVFGVMKGWSEALQQMNAGSRWQLFIPAELAYGDKQSGKIPPNSALIFELELVSINDGAGEVAAISGGSQSQKQTK